MNSCDSGYNNNLETANLINQGFQKISQEKYLERANDPQYLTNVFTTYLLQAGDEFINIDKATYDEYKALQPRSVKIEQSFFSKNKTSLSIEADLEKDDAITIDSLPNEILSEILNKIPAVKRQSLKAVSKRFHDIITGDTSIGSLKRLPHEIVSSIMDYLSLFEKLKIKTVSTGINIIASKSTNPEAREIALRNLELIRPYISEGFQDAYETCNDSILTTFYLDQEGQVIACSGDNSNILYNDKVSRTLIASRRTNDPKLQNHAQLKLYWNRKKSTEGLGNVYTPKKKEYEHHGIKYPSGFAKAVAEEMVLLANQLWKGSHNLAQRDNLRRIVLGGWLLAFENPSAYPTHVILEASKK